MADIVLSQHVVLESFAKMIFDAKTTATMHDERNR